MSEAALHANLALAAAVGLVLALRLPVRRLFGPRIAYGLWLAAPAATLAALLPARMVVVSVAAPVMQAVAAASIAAPAAAAVQPNMGAWALGVWAAGVLVSLAALARRQRQFAAAERAGRAGPAVVGVIRPRLVLPADFAARYTAREQAVVLAHEQAHLARHDSRVNALVALARAVLWFNPAVHVMARVLRVDQELACDAVVVVQHPAARRAYAEAMLKAQLTARPLPLGCHWLGAPHPLAARVRLLSAPAPRPWRRALGGACVSAIAAAAAAGSWAARPAEVVEIVRASAAPAAALAPRPAVARAPRPAAAPRKSAPPPQPIPAAAAPAPPPVAEAAPPMPEPPPPQTLVDARRSGVEPGRAVRVRAEIEDADGVPIWTDFTSFGSLPLYRKGRYWTVGSRYGIYSSVEQVGDRAAVRLTLARNGRPTATGVVTLNSGETGELTLDNGQVAKVTATVRDETPEEQALFGLAARRMAARKAGREEP